MKKKCQKESEQNREKQQRIETLERYLADLPTLEDHQKQTEQLKDAELKNTELQGRVAELETMLEDTQAACREKEVQLESLRQREAQFSSARHSFQDKQSLEEASGESLKVEMESQQKECDSLRKVTGVSESGLGRLGGKKRLYNGKEAGVPSLKPPRVCSPELFSLLRSQPCVVNLHLDIQSYRRQIAYQECTQKLVATCPSNEPDLVH